MMATRLIINADDFGFSCGVTDGILICHTQGILTSTTWMATMPDRDRAIDLALGTPTLGVGVHLCLTQGVALTKCSRILDRDGRFPRSLPKLFWRLRKQEARQQAWEEFSAQIAYAKGRGLVPTHVDSHKHVHHLPALHEAVIGAAKEQRVGWVRTAREVKIGGIGGGGFGYRMLKRYANRLTGRLAAEGLKTTDWFFGLATTGRTDAGVWLKILQGLPAGLGEVMVHPGFIEGITRADTRLLEERLVEQKALIDAGVREAVKAVGVVPASYPKYEY